MFDDLTKITQTFIRIGIQFVDTALLTFHRGYHQLITNNTEDDLFKQHD